MNTDFYKSDINNSIIDEDEGENGLSRPSSTEEFIGWNGIEPEDDEDEEDNDDSDY